MLNKEIEQLAAALAAALGSGFSSEAVGHLREGKVYKYDPEPVEIGPDDRRGNYLYIRFTDGASFVLDPITRGGCKVCAYNVRAALVAVVQSDCVSPTVTAAAVASALVAASPADYVEADGVSSPRLLLREMVAPADLPEMASAAKCELSAVYFQLSAVVDFAGCKIDPLC